MVGLSRGKKLLQRRDPLHSGSRTAAVLFFFHQARSVLEYCCTRQRVSYSSRVQQRFFAIQLARYSSTAVPASGFRTAAEYSSGAIFFCYPARSAVLEYCCTRQRVSYSSSRVQQRCYFFFYPARSVLEYCCTRQRVSYSSRVQQRCYFFLLPTSSLGTRVLLYPREDFVQQQYNSSSSTAERRITFCSTSSLGTLGVCTLFTDSMLDELLIALYCTKSRLRIKLGAVFFF